MKQMRVILEKIVECPDRAVKDFTLGEIKQVVEAVRSAASEVMNPKN